MAYSKIKTLETKYAKWESDIASYADKLLFRRTAGNLNERKIKLGY